MKHEHTKAVTQNGPLGFALFLAYLGAAVYFVNQASGFFSIIWAFIKAIVWPAILVYQAMQAAGV